MIKNDMKILLVSDAHRIGGAEHYLLLLSRELIKLNHKVEILCPDRKEWHDFAQTLKQAGATVHQIPLKSRHDLGRFYFLPFLQFFQIKRLKKYYKNINPDILHINTAGVEDGQTCILATRNCGLSTRPFPLVTNHAGIFIPYTVRNFNIRIIDYFRKKIMKKIDKNVKKRIAVSQATADLIVKEYKFSQKKFKIIYNGFDLPPSEIKIDQIKFRKEMGIGKNDILLISITHLHKEKGLDDLLKALQEILKYEKNTMLIIAGDGPYYDKLKNLSKDLMISDHVKFLGNRSDINNLLNISNIFILPSLGEGFPFVILEAMAAALPIIATTVGGIPEMINNNKEGYLVEPSNQKNLTEALKKLILDKKLAEQMGQKARARVQEYFSLSRMVEKTLEVYKEILKKNLPDNAVLPRN